MHVGATLTPLPHNLSESLFCFDVNDQLAHHTFAIPVIGWIMGRGAVFPMIIVPILSETYSVFALCPLKEELGEQSSTSLYLLSNFDIYLKLPA